MKRGIIGTLCNRATIMCQEKQDITEEIDNLKQDLLLSDYPYTLSAQFSALPWKSAIEFSHPKNLEKPISSVLLPYVEGV